MKYLKRFESKSEDFFEEVSDVFIEFIDNNIIDIWKDDGFIGMEFYPNIEITEIESAIKYTSEVLEIFKDIKVAISRLKEKFGDLIIKYNMDNDLSGFMISIYEPSSNNQSGDFYTISDNRVFLNTEELKNILKIDKGVNIGIWSDGSEQFLKIVFGNKQDFMNHMYRDYVDRRDELPSSFDNESVEDALIINPELMKRYWKLGNNFSKLKISGVNIIDKIEYISKGEEKTYYGTGGKQTREEYSVSLILNKKFKYII